MNDQVPDPVAACAHLTAPPARSYWLDELRLRDFPRLLAVMEHVDRLQPAIEREFCTSQRRWVLERLLEEHGDTDAVKLNLLMVSAFLDHRRSAAVFDVAQENLDAELIARCTTRAGERDRLALAALMYCKEPALLVAVDLWDRWHSHRRCVFELEGHPRQNLELGKPDWWALGRGALEDLGLEEVELRAVLPRRDGREVLLGFRQVGEWSNVRTESGEVVPGREDDWTLLLFYDGGNALDSTASNQARASKLANAVGEHLWGGEVRYVPVHRPLRANDLKKLLARLTNPLDHTFRLLEIVAVVPQLPHRPTVVLGNTEQLRVEEALVELRRLVPLAYDWKDVHSVKVGFQEQYRVAMQFPSPRDELVLTYADVDRNKEISLAFERLLADELGVVVKPRIPPEMRHVQRSVSKPKRLTGDHYVELLQPVVDRPDDWMLEALELLARDGLLQVTRSAVLRCGDASLEASTGGDTLDCPGELVMPYGTVDPGRPFLQSEDLVCACGTCGRRWYPGRTALPLFPRLRVQIAHEAVWTRLLERVRNRVALNVDRPGLASGMLHDERVCLVYLPLATHPADRMLSMAATFPTCWVGRPVPPGYRERGIDLADLLARKELPVMGAWKLGRDPLLTGRAEPNPAPVVIEPSPQEPLSTERRLKTRTFIADEAGIWLDGRWLADKRATGTRMLLALLWEAARTDDEAAARTEDKAKVVRKLRGHVKLGAIAGIKLEEKNLYTWVNRFRARLDRDFPGEADALIVSERGKGYRLGDGVVCVGLNLREEATAFEEWRRRGDA